VNEWAAENGYPTNYDISESDDGSGGKAIRALMYQDDLAKHCRKLEREAASAIEETGANMLFLVLGFLEYPDQKDSDKMLLSPLVSIPVMMSKKVTAGGKTSFSLQYTGEDISDNLSLKEKMRVDFSITLPDLTLERYDADLSIDDQIDIEGYFRRINSVIRNIPRFTVRRRVSLCLLSFTNMLLVRDLNEENWPQSDLENMLADHPLVKTVLGGGENEGRQGWGESSEYPVEEEPGDSIPLVYDADSSQHSALIDVLVHKKNLVIEGPPGTGKSQTITNLIAASIAEGKRVLFVAEKMAALEVVKNRLSMAGLDAFVLELHSNKSNKKRVLEDIEKRLKFRQRINDNLTTLLEQLEIHRNELKAYVDIVNSRVHNSIGKTIHQVMWSAERHRSKLGKDGSILAPKLVPDAEIISSIELQRRLDCLKHLSMQYDAIGGYRRESVYYGFYPENLMPGNENFVNESFLSAKKWLPKFDASVQELSKIANSTLEGYTDEFVDSQSKIVKSVESLKDISKPLSALPRLFENDKTGQKPLNVLRLAKEDILRYHLLQKTVVSTFKPGCSVSKDGFAKLMQFLTLSDGCGVALGSVHEIELLKQRLQHAESTLIASSKKVKEFSESKKIPYADSWQYVDALEKFSKVVLEPPLDLLHLQSPLLNQDGAVKALKHLKELQDQYTAKYQQLDEQLYLDALPSEREIRNAVLTLRSGGHWYSIFVKEWRDALRRHKSLQRKKKRIPAAERLAHLEKLLSLLSLQKTFLTDPTWKTVLGTNSPTVDFNIEEYLTLARWNNDVRTLSDELRIYFIEPETYNSEQARKLKNDYSLLKEQLVSLKKAKESLEQIICKLPELPESLSIEKTQQYTTEYRREVETNADWLAKNILSHIRYSDMLNGCEAFIDCEEIKYNFEKNVELLRLLGPYYQSVETETWKIESLLDVVAFGIKVVHSTIDDKLKRYILENDPIQAFPELLKILEELKTELKDIHHFELGLIKYGKFNVDSWVGVTRSKDLGGFVSTFNVRLNKVEQNQGALIPWSLYLVRKNEALELNLHEYVDLLENQQIDSHDLSDFYAYSTYSSIVKAAFANIPQLGRFTGLKHDQIRAEFRNIDKEIIKLRGKHIAFKCLHLAHPPAGNNAVKVNDKTQMALLNYLIPQTRPRMPVRKILANAGLAIEQLKPCFMMGPQAVAQYLTPGATKFDLIIMDEASQLKPEEAIGAIARGGQLVVVGDAKQLPPTSFFSATSTNEDEEQYTTTNLESILDVCHSQFDSKPLRWHYRSQHHSLIAFSNHHFYKGDLIVFPSPYGQGGKLGIKATYLADAIYDSQANIREAKRVVDAVIEHILTSPEDSLGVVTLNIKQRDLISELFEERQISSTAASEYRERWALKGQPLFFKNLENVQGDERDAIIISTTFGKANGTNVVRQNFGPISRQGGWRRLNVLFTRAKKSISIYTSLRPEDIVVEAGTPIGTKTLRNYLEFAQTGNLEAAELTNREPDSDFEIAVMDVLKKHGYEVTPQLGVGGFRIDIAVKHPERAGTYLAAIECDGATYHSAASVRDRDRIRQEILESMGWKKRIWRIWSTDWFRTPKHETDKLLSFLKDIKQNWVPEYISGESWVEEGLPIPIASTKPSVKPKSQPISVEEPEPAWNNLQNLTEQLEVRNAILEDENEIEVSIGDTVKYCDVAYPSKIMDVHITQLTNDIDNGKISSDKPLAQVLLGAVVNDEVVLNINGRSRTFRIKEIIREGL